MELLRVEGDAFERGLQQGRHFGPKVLESARQAIAALPQMPGVVPRWARPAFAGGLVGALGRLYLGRHRQTLTEHQGGKFERGLEGLAAGFGTTEARLYGFASFEIESARLDFTLGCTSLAFAAEAVEGGRPLLAYNHDFPPEFAAFPFVRASVPDQGFPSVAVTYPIALGALCGVNAAGLAVSLNHAWVRRVSSGEALPISMMVQDVLDRCTTVDEAIAAFSEVPRANGSMATFVDARGDRAALELTPQRVVVRRTAGPLLHTFNAYQTPEARRLEVPTGAVGAGIISGIDIHGSNLARQARFDALGAGAMGRWTREEIDALMADHDGAAPGANTICRHHDAWAETLLTARIDPVARTLSVGAGPACQAKLEVHSVPDALRAAA